jgi:hypothetical protein
MLDKLKIKRRRLNFKELLLISSFCLAFIFLYFQLTQFKSYVNRTKVTPRIIEYCSKFKKNKSQTDHKLQHRVAFFLIGTGKYISFIKQLIESMEKNFCSYSPHVYVHYFIFTDNTNFKPDIINKNRNFTNIFQEHLKWPMSTLLRFENILKVIF